MIAFNKLIKKTFFCFNSKAAQTKSSGKPSLRVKKLKDLMAPNSMSLRKLPMPLTPVVVESIVVEPDHQEMAKSSMDSGIIISDKITKEKQQKISSNLRCDTSVDLIDICDDEEICDAAENQNSATTPTTNNPNHPVKTALIEKKKILSTSACLSPKPAASAAATSIFVADPDPKIELGLSATPRPHLEIVEQPASNSLRFR